MKSYLNRTEKTQALTIASFVAYVTDTANEWAKHSRDKDAVKSLRMAKSFMSRAMDSLFKGLDPLEIRKVLNQVSKMEIVVKYSDEAAREYKRMQEIDGVTPVKTDDFYEICGQALGICSSCEDRSRDCRLRELFIQYDVPVANLSPRPGECPYCVEEVSA